MAREKIVKGQYITDYKYAVMYSSQKERKKAEDYVQNGEGSYILEIFWGGKKLHLDATRRFASYGRFATSSSSYWGLKTMVFYHIDTSITAGAPLPTPGPTLPCLSRGSQRLPSWQSSRFCLGRRSCGTMGPTSRVASPSG